MTDPRSIVECPVAYPELLAQTSS